MDAARDQADLREVFENHPLAFRTRDGLVAAISKILRRSVLDRVGFLLGRGLHRVADFMEGCV